jgi:NADH-quinone oxidoreductase subunit F
MLMSTQAYSSVEDFEKSAADIAAKRQSAAARPCVIIGGGTCGMARGAGKVAEAFKAEIAKRKLARKVQLRETGCHGFCQVEPLVVIEPEGIFYTGVAPEDQNKLVDPRNIEDYIAIGGYAALAKVLQGTPEQVIEEVLKSNLRGRGGAGFSTGSKWRFCRDASGSPKYIICNADEGDPGAYMDRSVLEGNPHSVIEIA